LFPLRLKLNHVTQYSTLECNWNFQEDLEVNEIFYSLVIALGTVV